MAKLSVLEYLKQQIEGRLPADATTEFRYPTAISKTLGFKLVEVEEGFARVEFDADCAIHGNQQGTVHGGMLAELADAAIGTAHSTAVKEGETFTTIELNIRYFRPVWKSKLTAATKRIQHGKTITHYQCEITDDQGKAIALATSTVMTLRGDSAKGR